MRVLTNSLSGVAVARNRMDRRGWWLCSIAVAVLLAGLARPAHAAKQFVYVSGASCQPDGLIFAVSPLTYTNYGVVYEGLNTVDVVCPITWAKPTVPTGQIVGELDIQVDWLSPGQTPSCSLGYWGPAGTFAMQALPIPYPVPTAMTNMKAATLVCTLPSYQGIGEISFNVCLTSTTNPGACPAP